MKLKTVDAFSYDIEKGEFAREKTTFVPSLAEAGKWGSTKKDALLLAKAHLDRVLKTAHKQRTEIETRLSSM